jgi:chloramphenicol O-acetyltransferase type A
MTLDPVGQAIHIDFDKWERRELFTFFDSFTEPFHGICLRVDCTKAFRYAKDHRLSVFLTLLHSSLVAAHRVGNFMMRSVDGEILRYRIIHGGSAVARPNGTIGFGYYSFRSDVHSFVREAAVEIESVKESSELVRYPRQDLIRYSVLPWLDFTSLSHARDLSTKDSTPRITFGKITHSNGHTTMPVSIHVHHGLVDGEHVARFVELFEQALAAPDSA